MKVQKFYFFGKGVMHNMVVKVVTAPLIENINKTAMPCHFIN